MKKTTWNSEYFCGNKISEYGLENGYIDYATLAKSFDAVMCNDIIGELENAGFYFEQENGFVDNSEEIEELEKRIEQIEDELYDLIEEEKEEIRSMSKTEIEKRIKDLENTKDDLEAQKEELENEENYPREVFQWFIISSRGAEILEDYTDEIVYYCEKLDMYVWGVTHWGTSWDYVLTDIKLEIEK